MDILLCLQKIHPGWNGAVFDNCHEGIKPHESETREIPSLKELEAVWPKVQEEMTVQTFQVVVKTTLAELDIKSIRALREWIVKQPDAPQFIRDYEAQAIKERNKLK